MLKVFAARKIKGPKYIDGIKIPATYKEVISGPYVKEWKYAMDIKMELQQQKHFLGKLPVPNTRLLS